MGRTAPKGVLHMTDISGQAGVPLKGGGRPLITVDKLCMEYDGRRVLENISFTVNEGETLGIIGRSGAGKSVLMHLMRGIEDPPTGGRVLYHVAICPQCSFISYPSLAHTPCPHCGGQFTGQTIDLWNDDKENLKRHLMNRTAIMFQRTFALYGDDRVIENVLHALEDIAYPPESAINRAADLIDQVRLSHRMMHIARDLSGGEKQRVVLARQLAKEPFLLFADEPTGTLDPETTRTIQQILLDSVRCNHMGMIVTSHFVEDIATLAQQAILLSEGRVAAMGTPAEILSRFTGAWAEPDAALTHETGGIIISAHNLTKSYMTVDRGVIRAVNDVSFEVATGEIFGIVGRSGAGKTTLSRILAGLIEPTRGEMNIRIGDNWVDMTKPGIDQRGRAKEYIGYLHQEYDLFPHRTVLDNLTDAIGLEYPKELAMRKALVTLGFAGFSEETRREILNRFPDQLSVGEKHRVALAQVLIHEPRIVVLDEPTGTMDPITKNDVRESILHARDEMEETFIVISHDLEFVRATCDRVVVMSGGKIVAAGNPNEVLEKTIPTGNLNI